jgi:hypothetical protein
LRLRDAPRIPVPLPVYVPEPQPVPVPAHALRHAQLRRDLIPMVVPEGAPSDDVCDPEIHELSCDPRSNIV